MSTRILVLGGRRTVQQLQEESDYDVVFAEENMTLEQVMLADYPLEVDFGDWASVSRQVAGVHAQQPIHAVVTGVERLVPLAGRLREELELDHGITERAARNCIDKAATHRLLEGAGVPVPRTRVVSGAQEGGEAAEGLGLPVVVKPRDASSAAGLAYCDTRTEVEQAIAGILAGGRDSALVEEYVQGPEFGVFAARTAGATRVLWVVEGEVGPPPTFVKVGGHFPARLGEEDRRELDRLADLALTAVGLDDWVAALQFTLTADGWRAGEINPRVPGGQAVEMIRSTTGWEPSLVAAEAALGRHGEPRAADAACGLYRSIVFEEAGRIDYDAAAIGSLGGLESSHPPFVEFDVAPGESVLPVGHPRGGAFGRIVLAGESPEQLERDLARVTEQLAVRLADEQVNEGSVDRAHTSCC
ncbi:acetyl-CoA carboxylase biotin carboxylase subunit family protein [Streptomyces microflavus]|uniref:ATP-grasp domain-containing protein n=1 Tax=Streptomyces microflavus TaxID=1919 RepID=A0A7H8MGL0_STRMI|nr:MULTISPECIES: ATP-grasp domain-containing protein [Streptomyces]MBW3356950.1 ATP-grasp domain-containing protein [Streptomyces sp. 09ZI22]QKW41370.1 ATP-grasp domain-containing protein [Streptomyces microflavus]